MRRNRASVDLRRWLLAPARQANGNCKWLARPDGRYRQCDAFAIGLRSVERDLGVTFSPPKLGRNEQVHVECFRVLPEYGIAVLGVGFHAGADAAPEGVEGFRDHSRAVPLMSGTM